MNVRFPAVFLSHKTSFKNHFKKILGKLVNKNDSGKLFSNWRPFRIVLLLNQSRFKFKLWVKKHSMIHWLFRLRAFAKEREFLKKRRLNDRPFGSDGYDNSFQR